MGRPIDFHCIAGAGAIAAADRASKEWIVRLKATTTDSRPVRIRRTNSKVSENTTGRTSVRPFSFAAR
jgi:hypothetical protein